VEVKAGASYTPYYYHADGLGSITGLSDATGTMVQTYSYDAFGNVTPSGNVSQPFMFTGREYDAETSMYFYRARYYDPVVGRFVTRDPIGLRGGFNLFTYVENNPTNRVDPTGTVSCSKKCHGFAIASCHPVCHWMLAVPDAGPALWLFCEVICHELMYDRCMADCEKGPQKSSCK
jgi:RHS repeat-associated protein